MKSFFETALSWCCRKHVFVFEIVSLNGLNECMIKLSFSLWLLGKRFQFAIIEKVWKLFHFGRWLSFCSRKLNFGIWEGDFVSRAPGKVLMCSLFLDTSWNRGILARGKAREKFSASGFTFERLTFLSKIENRLKRGEIFVWKFHKKKVSLNFQRTSEWWQFMVFLAFFSFQWLCSLSFEPKILAFDFVLVGYRADRWHFCWVKR